MNDDVLVWKEATPPPATSTPEKGKNEAAPASSGLLVWRTRESSRHLLLAMVYSLGIATATGVVLAMPLGNGHLTLVALVAHLVSGALALVFFIPFLFVHLHDGKEKLLNLVMPWRMLHQIYRGESLYHRILGYMLTCCLLLTVASGLVIAAPAVLYLTGKPTVMPFGTAAALLRVHITFAGLFVFFVLLHFPKRALS
ncbi:MAG: hypothetical protein LBI92_03285 [Azoarcus sp.]|jgi:hypothetical protein|nr:hypothetical protein [Azoarcus sp.]